jgi:crotonobetainyl-CoA:carnitine CoA-transferase CaiB-like acyl-CoA transferase
MTLPLDGFRVLEMGHVISGPYAGMVLVDLGAEVIKVEMPGKGDTFRHWEAEQSESIRSSFAAYNRGKKSVTINIQTESGRELYKKLAAGMDALLENFRPGALDRYGVGYDDLRKINPGLVYCSISGFGPNGPYKHRPAFNEIGMAMGGLWSQLTDLEDPRPVAPGLGDYLTGVHAAIGILGALVSKAKTGKGRKLDVSMMGSVIGFQRGAIAGYTMEGRIPDAVTRPRFSQSYAFVGSDGKPFAVHLSTPAKFWQGLCRVTGRADLIDEPRFRAKRGRIEAYDELRGIFGEIFKTRPRHQWLAELEAADVPCGPIFNIGEALDDPQTQLIGLLKTFGEGARALKLGGLPVSYSDTTSEPALPPPLLGEHNEEVFGSLGYNRDDLNRLKAEGAI